MRTLTNKKLTENFSLYEFLEGKAMPKKGIEMVWRDIAQFNETNAIKILQRIEQVRENTNNIVFRRKNRNRVITITINVGFRPRAWEMYMGRSGNGQHPLSTAVDIVPGNCSRALKLEIMRWWKNIYSPYVSGWYGGFAVKKPTYNKQGMLVKVGYAHFDDRMKIARWEY